MNRLNVSSIQILVKSLAGLLIAAAVLVLPACSSGDGSDAPAFTPRFAGYYSDGSHDIPCYWEGTTMHSLGEGLPGSGYAYSPVAVSGGNVYSAGCYIVDSRSVPCYWEGTTRHELLDSEGAPFKNSARAYSIAMSGSSVFAAGYYFNGSRNVPCYWKNGIMVSLGAGLTGSGQAFSIVAVSENMLYTAGYYNNGSRNVPCYWIGTALYELMDESGGASLHGDAWVYSIAVSGGTVYTAGYYNNGSRDVPCYWVGTALRELKDASGSSLTEDASASSIAVSGGKVYAAGCLGGKICYPCYWADDRMIELTAGQAVKSRGEALAISLSGAAVFAAGGYIDAAAGRYLPCYWEDGIIHELKDDQGERFEDYASVMAPAL